MDQLTKKTLKVTRGFTYTYYTSPAKDTLPTVFLIHGWPDTADLWTDVIRDYLLPAGYGVVAPDCLGYGGTSKPDEPKQYNFQLISNDFIEILDAENLPKIISLGHDWGSGLAQKIYSFHPERVLGLVLLNVAYLAPSKDPFNLDAVIERTTKFFGYGTYWYWKFFTAPDAPKLMNENIDSSFDVAHGEPETWLETLCVENGVRNFVTQGKRQPVQPYANDQMRQAFKERMSRDKFDGPQCYYRSMVDGVQDEPNRAIPLENYTIKVPILFFAGANDKVCRPELMGISVQAGLVPDLKTVTVDAGHWSMHAKPKEFGEALTDWLKERFPAGAKD